MDEALKAQIGKWNELLGRHETACVSFISNDEDLVDMLEKVALVCFFFPPNYKVRQGF